MKYVKKDDGVSIITLLLIIILLLGIIAFGIKFALDRENF